MKKVTQQLRKLENEKYRCPKCGGRTVKGGNANGKKRRKCMEEECRHQYFIEYEQKTTTHSEKIFMHAAIGFTTTICGINFVDTVPCRMTNSIKDVDCPDCVLILKIRGKNKRSED